MINRCAHAALKVFADSPCGDVLAARSCATTLLADIQIFGADLACERLLVTAALIHLQSETDERLTLGGLSALLMSLSTAGPARHALSGSPSLLVQYVAAAAQDGDFSAALSAAPNLFLTARARKGLPVRLCPSLPSPEAARPKPSPRGRRRGGASSGDRT